MFQQEINEWVEENCRVTGVLNKHRKFDRHDQLINCDIPSQIINEVEQHWFIVAIKKRWREAGCNEKRFLWTSWRAQGDP